MIDEKEYIALMKNCIANDDAEKAHSNADDILCKLLVELGYSETVGLYGRVAKWYA